MNLPPKTTLNMTLDKTLKIGVNTMHRRTEPGVGQWLPKIDVLVRVVEQVDQLGYDSFWCGDHISMEIPFLDPLLQIAQAAVASRRLMFGTSVYLLPLRHPTPVAKQVATIDLLTEGRFIFGVGVGGEFPKEYEACGVPRHERGARLAESIQVCRKLWSGDSVSNDGKFYPFEDVRMTPAPAQLGGPPIWCGGRAKGALERTGRMGDGWFSYAVTPQMYRDGLAVIDQAANDAGRVLETFGTAHLLFARVADSADQALDEAAEHLSIRYGMDMRPATKRYGALGAPEDVAACIRAYHDAGVRHISLDFAGPYERRYEQLERFANEVRPLLQDLM
ncbi:MAG: LLM class flavin-dependent oxidoreductase [Rhodospirillaceae bacterium]|jgi:probable F420-dependent oxidoreductase|nr:LLM class flavin-dependent oxidoreductase [Rhodospirillaceae bacterium]MBT5080070.1 LLM class flavin-dependent oxidoreductase [Rhodospirillaceae bacterium]MBT5525659.1 LLM class flavin-dependent oxidoreductase [Rhodospirillaceae bacterium]MBT5880418.1 LLM class flavin-dependent oxidoreductase [Rhodospirillaceae bacterium]MBT6590907.1 LLM class flavin-dependent oxidoreductase [Rhodospirillaceae bacterium]